MAAGQNGSKKWNTQAIYCLERKAAYPLWTPPLPPPGGSHLKEAPSEGGTHNSEKGRHPLPKGGCARR